MSRLARFFAVALVAAGAYVACGPPPKDGVATLTLTLNPRIITDPAQIAEIAIEAVNADGTPGAGKVTLETLTGMLSTNSVTLNANGQGTADFSCDWTADESCTGQIRLDAVWKAASGDVSVTTSFLIRGPNSGTDGGNTDGGDTDAGSTDAGNVDAGNTDAGTDGGNPTTDGGSTGDAGVRLTLTTTRSRIFLNVGDFSEITAALRTTDGGAIADESISFTATMGGFTEVGGATTPVSPLTVSTQSNGNAIAHFRETGTAGNSTVTATHTTSGASATLPVEIVNVQQITWISTKCGGTDCTIMGIKGSGFNEQAQVTFEVKDSSNRVAPGVTVSFSLLSPPTGTTVAPTGVTDANGRVTVNVSAGAVTGAFSVHATVIPGMVETDSLTIGIRGAKPSNQGFAFQCNPVNVAAYVDPTPPAMMQVPCTVKLVDRFNNPVGTGTSVNFKVEAGSIPNAIATKKYVVGGANSDEGYGTINFDTNGPWPAVDVPALPADGAQWPNSRDAEPTVADGALTRNPRDGLVTILAYVKGEEYYFDTNSNGVRDTNERFIDQGEPFVDANDNGTWDNGEDYIDLPPPGSTTANGVWDGPNGQWDGDTTVWTETRILYTSRPIVGSLPNSFVSPNPFAGFCGTTPLGKGVSVGLYATFGDLNLNRPQSASTSFSTTHTATKGSLLITNSSIQDGYGFGIERRLLDASTSQGCTAASAICVWKYLFYDWRHISTAVTLTGAPPTDVNPCQNDNVTISADVLGIKTGIVTSGGIQ